MNKVLITSQGRTATLSLSQSLNELPGVRSFHERQSSVDREILHLSQSAEHQEGIRDYLRQENAFANSLQTTHYVAVNPYLRFTGPVLEQEFGWNVAHLVRHPKTYLESVYVRNTLRSSSAELKEAPEEDDPFASRWKLATRFEKLCWYYARTLSYFANTTISWYKYEEITTDVWALNTMLNDLGLPPFASNFTLPRTNAQLNYKQRLRQYLSLAVFPKNLNWNQLEDRELETYHYFFNPLAKHFGYDL